MSIYNLMIVLVDFIVIELLTVRILILLCVIALKLVAVFDEASSSQPTQNGGYGTSASSIGTASPDLSQDEISNAVEEPVIKPYTPGNKKIEYAVEEIKTFSASSRNAPPPVPPKPMRQVGNNNRKSFMESVPSEDSGISTQDDRLRISSDSSKSEISETTLAASSVQKGGETTFVAIGTPVKTYNGDSSTAIRRRYSSTSSDHADNEHSDEETFSLGRNLARKSMFVDSPLLDRWAELQEERVFQVSSPRRIISIFVVNELYLCTLTLSLLELASPKLIKFPKLQTG